MGKRKGKLYIGTSGWVYPHWRGPFYPEALPQKRWLEFYAERFDSVEVNNSFYKLPKRRTLSDWARRAPKRFLFAVKGSRYLTHMKKLKDSGRGVRRFFSAVEGLGGKLGPVVFQLPPRWKADPRRLKAFLEALPKRRRCAFEFRDRSWFDEEVYRALERRGAALCLYQLAGYSSPVRLTARWTYIRLHGPSRSKYQGSYGGRQLAAWARRIKDWTADGRDVYIYFDNDQRGYAAKNAAKLGEKLSARRRRR